MTATREAPASALVLAGVHHAALSVRDVDAASRWYGEVLGLAETFRREAATETVVVLHSSGLRTTLGLVEHTHRGAGFAPRNVGLDHLAFRVASEAGLWAWSRRLADCGVAHSGPVETPFGGMLQFCDLDGIALALFWERGAEPGGPGSDTSAPRPHAVFAPPPPGPGPTPLVPEPFDDAAAGVEPLAGRVLSADPHTGGGRSGTPTPREEP
jgi:glyoxylase I family protein